MRLTITLIALLLGLAVVGGMFYHASQDRDPAATPRVTDQPTAYGQTQPPAVEKTQVPTADTRVPETTAAVTEDATPELPPEAAPEASPEVTKDVTPKPADESGLFVFEGLRMAEPESSGLVTFGSDASPGADKPGFMAKVVLTPWGAGVQRITLAEYRMGVDGAWAEEPYVIIDHNSDRIAPFAARQIVINGSPVNLASQTRWQAGPVVETEDGASVTLTAQIIDGNEQPVGQVRRTYRLTKGSYDLQLEQEFVNESGRQLTVGFLQNAQGDLFQDPAAYMGDRREFVTGYFNPDYDDKLRIYTSGSYIHRDKVISKKAIWPHPNLGDEGYELAWVASENRYFSVVIHPNVPISHTETRAIPYFTETFPTIGVLVHENTGRPKPDNQALMFTLERQGVVLAPGEALDLSVGIYAGPRKKQVLTQPPYDSLYMHRLVRYNIGGMCAWFTFQWLANGLLGFMRLIHAVTFDWGIAIIVLVMCVRLILHPITKRAQVNMMKMGKQMAALQPEIEKIKKKYKDDQQKLNGEMMKLYREKGVNPAGFLGCAPMMLQTPIWIALYAMLYFAIELRHEPAFYGVFQAISGGGWHFLQDLSVSDNFIRFIPMEEDGIYIPLISGFLGQVRALNILPLMMGVVFYINQKLTTPPPANEQQAQQQKIMKYMVLLFPVFLYNAPSGLTLYIFTSTLFGILDGYMVRKHIKEQEAAGTLFDKKPRKPGGIMDRVSKMMQQKQLQMQQAQREAQKSAPNTPKKRKR